MTPIQPHVTGALEPSQLGCHPTQNLGEVSRSHQKAQPGARHLGISHLEPSNTQLTSSHTECFAVAFVLMLQREEVDLHS